ncbi:MAG TPA: hypothetical protein VMT56_02605 [Candidatus Bathyarchaeia archaeon]|nr:hypothetical protein [Candidatus Bathyarchaeia archaeon]
MPKARETEKFLVQIRLTAAQRTRIKSLAARQNMTIQKAVVEAFEAWAEKLRADRRNPRETGSRIPEQSATQPLLPALLKQALKLDWTKCPEVELLDDGENHLWMLRDSEAPLNVVLRAAADGIPMTEIADAFELELPRLARVLKFAATAQEADALN